MTGSFLAGVARVYTPKDYRIATIVADLAELGIAHRRGTVDRPPRQAPE